MPILISLFSAFLTLSASSAEASSPIRLKTSDGKSLVAQYERVSGAKTGVVLVHQEGRDQSDWTRMAARLKDSGVISVRPDLRGHGVNVKGKPPELTEDDFKLMTHEVRAAAAYLAKMGATEVVCIGASVGANLCLRAAASDLGIHSVVMLSPGMNIKGVTTVDALARYTDRPLLLVASEEDKIAARTAAVLEERANTAVHFELLSQAGRGTKMLNRDGGLEGLVVSWVLGTFNLQAGESSLLKGTLSNPGSVETTGTKLGE